MLIDFTESEETNFGGNSITIGTGVSEVYFVGDPMEVYTFGGIVLNEPDIPIHFVNFNYEANSSEGALVGAGDSTIYVEGISSIVATGQDSSGNGAAAVTGFESVTIMGGGELSVMGADGKDGVDGVGGT